MKMIPFRRKKTAIAYPFERAKLKKKKFKKKLK
jgi:hypothetical protein